MPDEPTIVEAPHLVAAVAPGHGRDIGDMRRIAHRRHGGIDVARLELGGAMSVERGCEPFGIGTHRARPLRRSPFTFFSTTSQIMAATSAPPNWAICLMPVGEVTLISVRRSPITSMPVKISPRFFSSG